MTEDELFERVMGANSLLGAGRWDEAERVLQECVEPSIALGPHPVSLLTFWLLGKCARTGGRLGDARELFEVAWRIAVTVDDPLMRVTAAVGVAEVEAEDGSPARAREFYREAVTVARQGEPGPDLAAALQGYATFLHQQGDDESSALFEEALAQPGLAGVLLGTILSNHAQELQRQDRIAEAIDRQRQAVSAMFAAGSAHRAFRCLVNLADLSRGVDGDLARDAFVSAHDLAHDLHGQVDAEHYTEGHQAAVARIEERSVQLAVERDGLSGADLALHMGVSEAHATDSVEQGERLIMRQEYAEAERHLREAMAVWDSLGALHRLPRVWNALGLLHKNLGDIDSAHGMFDFARRLAGRFGVAEAEAVALVNLCVLWFAPGRRSEEHLLELLAKARALTGFLRDQRLAAVPEQLRAEFHWDVGTLDRLASTLCLRYGALDLAETYARRSLKTLDRGDDPYTLSALADNLMQLVELAQRQGRAEQESLSRLQAMVAHPDALVRYKACRNLGLHAFDAGELTESTLDTLRTSCVAFEELRSRRGESATLDQRDLVAGPPYVEAAELALHLGDPAEALTLLEQSKSRALLDALRDHAVVDGSGPAAEEAVLWDRLRSLRGRELPDSTETHLVLREMRAVAAEIDEVRARLSELWQELSATHPHLGTARMAEPVTAAELPGLLAPHGDAVLVEFLVGRSGVHALICTAEGLRSVFVGHAHELRDGAADPLLAAAADGSPATRAPLLPRLASVIDDAARSGPIFVVPHGILHLSPLHLDATGEVRPRTRLLPSASVLRSAATRRPATTPVVVLAGDPTGDLPFARAECAHAAARFGVPTRTGADATAAWLAEALTSGDTKLVHLACHGEFDSHRPERSGLLLAGPEKLALDRLAVLDWSGALVLLSACHVGRHQVRRGDDLAGLGRTLLAAGATALIMSPRPVPDLPTALLMTWLHDQLDPATPWDLDQVSAALATAQHRVRDVTARDLITWCAGHAGTGHEQSLLACALVATAHQAAGNPFQQAVWLEHHRAGGQPDERVWALQTVLTADPAYVARPFADPVNWSSFAVFGA